MGDFHFYQSNNAKRLFCFTEDWLLGTFYPVCKKKKKSIFLCFIPDLSNSDDLGL